LAAAELRTTEKIDAGAEQAAEKGQGQCKIPEKHPAGAKARCLLSGTCGTTKVVPCYKNWPESSFSAACEARHLLAEQV
jgi:hypothetical protein